MLHKRKWDVTTYLYFTVFEKKCSEALTGGDMEIRRCCAKLVLLVLAVCVVFGQSAERVELSAEMAIEMAMKNNHTIKSLEHQQKQTEYDIKSATAAFLPGVSLNGSYSRKKIEGLSGMFDPNMASAFGLNENSFNYGLQIQQPIFTGFALLNGLNSAKLSNTITKESTETVRQKIRYAVLQIYWGIVSLQKSKSVASEAIKQLEELTSNQEARMEQGMSTEHDYLLTKASLAQARMNELKVNKSVSSMKRQFAILLGLPATTEIALIDTSAEGNLAPDVNLDSAVSSALSGRPDLKETRLKMDLAQLGIKSAKSAFYPSIVAGFGYSNESPEPDIWEMWRYNWAASVSLKFNLLDWGDRNFKVKKAKEQQLALKEMLQEKTATVEKEVLDAYHEVEQLQSETEAADLLMEARGKAYDASLAKYEEGVIPMYELLDAHNALISAKYSALQTATSLKLAVINLDMGGLGSVSSNSAQ